MKLWKEELFYSNILVFDCKYFENCFDNIMGCLCKDFTKFYWLVLKVKCLLQK